MTDIQSLLDRTRNTLLRLAEVMVLLVAVIVLLHILLGEAAGSYAMMVSGNVAAIIGFVSPETVAALILALALITAFRRTASAGPAATSAPADPLPPAPTPAPPPSPAATQPAARAARTAPSRSRAKKA